MAGDIWVVVDFSKGAISRVTREMLQDAEEIAAPLKVAVCAILINGGDPEECPWEGQVGPYGADRLIHVQTEGLVHLTAEAQSLVLQELAVQTEKPTLVILANTYVGQETAARLAAKWQVGFAHDVVSFSVDSQGIVEAVRVTHGEQLETIVEFREGPVVLSFRPGSAGIGAPRPDRELQVHTFTMDLSSASLKQKVNQICPADHRSVDITEADRIVAGGQGVGSPENFKVLQELADALGAAVAGSRLADDKGWVSVDRRVGLTGKTVSPQFYLAVGISGAREHVIGMSSAKVVVAINNDPRAEIFSLAHLGVLGDAREIMLALVQKLRVKPT